jgi:hypothetical protein
MVKSGANSEAEKEYHSISMFQAGNILPILKIQPKRKIDNHMKQRHFIIYSSSFLVKLFIPLRCSHFDFNS